MVKTKLLVLAAPIFIGAAACSSTHPIKTTLPTIVLNNVPNNTTPTTVESLNQQMSDWYNNRVSSTQHDHMHDILATISTTVGNIGDDIDNQDPAINSDCRNLSFIINDAESFPASPDNETNSDIHQALNHLTNVVNECLNSSTYSSVATSTASDLQAALSYINLMNDRTKQIQGS